MPETDASLGRAFVDALGAKDFERLAALLDPQIEFRGLTPGRAWEATDSDGVVEGVQFVAEQQAYYTERDGRKQGSRTGPVGDLLLAPLAGISAGRVFANRSGRTSSQPS